MKTFAQGIHPQYHKQKSEQGTILEVPAPAQVIIPLHQHTGATCEPLVKVGDDVVEGQKIGDSSKFISAPVHASMAGKVKKIEKLPHPCGVNILSIVIENESAASEDVPIAGHHLPTANHHHVPGTVELLNNTSIDEIRKTVREAGIVGLGGAAFPTHVKLTPPQDKKIDTLIINGCECEPYITADHRIMLERPEDILFGARLMAKAVGAKRIIVGIEGNKEDAIERLNSEINVLGLKDIDIDVLETKYPQGGEKMLIKAILNREVPSNGLPLDVGVVVANVGTAVAVSEAIKIKRPLTRRVLTLTGSGIKEPKNLLVRIGTSFKHVIESAGSMTEDAAKIVMGGPMMGVAQYSLEVPVIKATSCILVLNQADAVEAKSYPCVKCARCVDHCPMSLMPTRLAAYAEYGNYSEFDDWGGMDCIECGCCSFICPANIPLVQWIKYGKLKLRQLK
ncbi:MAG: electron transport complex subunit RsxC [Candidatus Margulisbacteria bacterium]|nr:electron transport complex subunit RsxC [Candidatus Margulisiibacteriota bacterium]